MARPPRTPQANRAIVTLARDPVISSADRFIGVVWRLIKGRSRFASNTSLSPISTSRVWQIRCPNSEMISETFEAPSPEPKNEINSSVSQTAATPSRHVVNPNRADVFVKLQNSRCVNA